MSWTVVNSVFKGRFGFKLDLEKLRDLIPNSVLHDSKPNQLVIKYNKVTVILFSRGAVRVMGNVDECYAYLMMIQTCEKFSNEIPDLHIQTMTVLVTLPTVLINLYKLYDQTPSTYEFELFPSLRITKYNPLCVNVFSTGKVLICGIKDTNKIYIIINELIQMLQIH
jgi:TATA-box binding protein (TBP) (component of TFIID and TFIIIB)